MPSSRSAMDPSDRAVCIRIAQREALAPQCKGGSALDRQGSAAARAGRSEPGGSAGISRGCAPHRLPLGLSSESGPRQLRVGSARPPRGACRTILRDRPLAPRRVGDGRPVSRLPRATTGGARSCRPGLRQAPFGRSGPGARFSRLPARARWIGDPARPGRPGVGGAYVNEQARPPRAVGLSFGGTTAPGRRALLSKG